MTISAPSLRGCIKYGVVKVLSTMNGIFASLATLDKFSISNTFIFGLPIVSAKISLVLSFIAFLKLLIFVGSTNVVSIPNLGKV